MDAVTSSLSPALLAAQASPQLRTAAGKVAGVCLPSQPAQIALLHLVKSSEY